MKTTKPQRVKTTDETADTPVTVEPGIAKKAIKKSPKQVSVTTSPTQPIVAKKVKNPKTKVIRDSFSFPEQDYLKISELKKACLAVGIPVKKGEILRAGLHLLTQLNLSELKQVVVQVERVKTGRPLSSEIR